VTPTSVMLAAAAAAIAADVTTLANPLFLKVYLVKVPFVPGGNLTVADLTPADFAGAAALSNSTATMQVFVDPATGEWIIQVPEPVGGWHWVTTSGVTNLPQTIYGWACVDNTSAILYGSDVFGAPILLNGDGQGINVDQVLFRLSAGALS
jgi:hypothetical protein